MLKILLNLLEKKGFQYDIIIGNVADDDVFKTVDIYYRSRLSEQIAEVKYIKDVDVLSTSFHLNNRFQTF